MILLIFVKQMLRLFEIREYLWHLLSGRSKMLKGKKIDHSILIELFPNDLFNVDELLERLFNLFLRGFELIGDLHQC